MLGKKEDGTPNWRVLFVDDDPFYRDLAADALGAAGMAHAVAADGDDAMQQLEAAACNVLILDLSMPGRSGFEIVASLRASERYADLPIIVVTGSDDEATITRAFELGATSFMVKPLNWQLFVQNVRFVLQAAHARSDLRRAQRTAEFMSDLKSRLIGTLVTEFQAPMRSAFNFSRLLNQQADGPLQSQLYVEWAGELQRSLERLSSVHLKMLNFGRSLSDQIELDEQTLDIATLVSVAVDNQMLAARRRNLVLTFDNAIGAQVLARADGVLVSNALNGVLDKAVKFTPRGGTVTVTLGQTDNGTLAITVADQQPTMTQHQIDEVLGVGFFATVRPETIDAVSALKMSRVLIEAHQGQMRLRANGDGMVTALTLPVGRRVAAPAAVAPVRQALKRSA